MILLVVDAKGTETATNVQRIEPGARGKISFWVGEDESWSEVDLHTCIRVELLPEN
jgi:hypothetical protein